MKEFTLGGSWLFGILPVPVVCFGGFREDEKSLCGDVHAQSKNVRISPSRDRYQVKMRTDGAADWHQVMVSVGRVSLGRMRSAQDILAYVSEENGKPALYLQLVDSGRRAHVTEFEKRPKQVCFSPDGTAIRVLRESGKHAEVPVAEVFSEDGRAVPE